MCITIYFMATVFCIIFKTLKVVIFYFPGCGGDFTGPSGTISSPHYPADYDNDLHCVYTITVGAGKVSLEKHSN